MEYSLSRRLLPWTLLLVLAIASGVLYFRAPKGDFEFDLRDPKLAGSPTAGYSEVVRRELETRAAECRDCKAIEPVKVLFKLEGRTQCALFSIPLAAGRFRFVTVNPRGDGGIIEKRRLTLKGCEVILRDALREADSVGMQLLVTHGPPDCTMRQWADFLRMGEELGITWGAHSSR